MKLFCLLTLFFTLTIQAQFQINGIVTDSNNKPLPFATITTSDNINTITDVDGKFIFTLSAKANTLLRFLILAFKPKLLPLQTTKNFIRFRFLKKQMI